MTKDQIRKHLVRQLEEYFDGFILVGQIVDSEDIVLKAKWKGRESGHRIMCGAVNLVNFATDSGKTDLG